MFSPDSFLHRIAEAFAGWNPSIPRPAQPWLIDEAAHPVYWYTTPQHYVAEGLATHAVLVPLLFLISALPWRVWLRSAVPHQSVSSRDVWAGKATEGGQPKAVGVVKDSAWLVGLDIALRAALAVCFVALLVFKLPTGRGMYMLQPCHMNSASYLWLGRWGAGGTKSRFDTVLFALCVCEGVARGEATCPCLCPAHSHPPFPHRAAFCLTRTARCWRW